MKFWGDKNNQTTVCGWVWTRMCLSMLVWVTISTEEWGCLMHVCMLAYYRYVFKLPGFEYIGEWICRPVWVCGCVWACGEGLAGRLPLGHPILVTLLYMSGMSSTDCYMYSSRLWTQRLGHWQSVTASPLKQTSAMHYMTFLCSTF